MVWIALVTVGLLILRWIHVGNQRVVAWNDYRHIGTQRTYDRLSELDYKFVRLTGMIFCVALAWILILGWGWRW